MITEGMIVDSLTSMQVNGDRSGKNHHSKYPQLSKSNIHIYESESYYGKCSYNLFKHLYVH